MTACLMWGWLTEAAIFGLAWCGLLRIGEALEANRADLILGTAFALLQVRTPKTRGRAARHQAVRIDPVDIMQLLGMAFSGLPSEAYGQCLRALSVVDSKLCFVASASVPTKELPST